jgi:hypothetical protein
VVAGRIRRIGIRVRSRIGKLRRDGEFRQLSIRSERNQQRDGKCDYKANGSACLFVGHIEERIERLKRLVGAVELAKPERFCRRDSDGWQP